MDAVEGPRSTVLFVDDEQKVVDGLRRTLHSCRKKWDMTFVTTPEEALRLIRERHFDVIVADMRMPNMTGAELLEKVREESSSTVRIILSGQAEASAIMKSVGPSHQFLSKPCDAAALEGAIQRACALRSHLADPKLADLVGSIDTLPSLPSIYQELVAAIKAEASMKEIGAIIARDLAMSVKILKLVNSSYFGPSRQITDPARAATMLGVETIQALVLGVKIFEQFPESQLAGGDVEALWERSGRAASYARAICLAEKADAVMTSQTSLAAFLHDIGELILQNHMPREVADVRKLIDGGTARGDAERQVIGATHGDVGGHLAALWGFPDPIIEAVTFHEEPSRCASHALTALTIVHVAQALAHAGLPGPDEDTQAPLDRTYLEAAGGLARLPAWLQRCRAEQPDPSA
jgi:HD-like signal output (HDOD) protein